MADPNADTAAVADPETWHVNTYHEKFNPSTKAGQAIFEKKTKKFLETSASLQQRKIPREFVAYYKRNLHRWAQWLLESCKNMMAQAM